MRILALDQATQCGYCHSDGESGSWDLGTKLKPEVRDRRLINLRKRLDEFAGRVDFVAYESPRSMRNYNALALLLEMVSVIKVWCMDNGNIPCRGYAPTSLKKWATGRGDATKEQMEHWCKRKWGIDPIDDNHADAVHLFHMAQEELR